MDAATPAEAAGRRASVPVTGVSVSKLERPRRVPKWSDEDGRRGSKEAIGECDELLSVYAVC